MIFVGDLTLADGTQTLPSSFSVKRLCPSYSLTRWRKPSDFLVTVPTGVHDQVHTHARKLTRFIEY